MPGGVWRTAFSIRLSASRCSSSRAPSTTRRLRRRRRARGPSATAPSSPAASTSDLRRGRSAACGACAVGVGAREQQQVGDEAAHAPRGAQRATRRPRPRSPSSDVGQQLEVGEHARQRRAQLVRGVGDELALARERGLGLRARGVERAASMPSSVRASSATSSSASRLRGRAARGRACASISRAVAVSAAIGAIARRASHSPPSSASAVPPSTPRSRKKPHARDRRARGRRPAARTGRRRGRRALRRSASDAIARARLDAVAADCVAAARRRRAPKFGAPRRLLRRICAAERRRRGSPRCSAPA